MRDFIERLGIADRNPGVYAGEWIDRPDAPTLDSVSPVDGERIASVTLASEEDYERAVATRSSGYRSTVPIHLGASWNISSTPTPYFL